MELSNNKPVTYIYIIQIFISLIKLGKICLLFSFLFLIDFWTYIFEKPLSKLQKKETYLKSLDENFPRKLEPNDYDTYITIYFKKECNYSNGFKNYYRNDIGFLVNKENNVRLTSDETFIIHENTAIEIHFNKSVKSLRSFFDDFYDKNVQYLVSIDLSNFDSSLVTDMYSLFYGCISLESINLSKFNTSLVTNMGSMFGKCSSLKSIDLSKFDTSLVTNMKYMFFYCSSLTSINV